MGFDDALRSAIKECHKAGEMLIEHEEPMSFRDFGRSTLFPHTPYFWIAKIKREPSEIRGGI